MRNTKRKELELIKKMSMQKRNNGITLIALVVTVIVNRVFYDKNIKLRNLVGSSLWFIYTYNRIVIEKIIILFF